MRTLRSADVFCEVIDNFGDAGVCWRLARALAARGLAVTLWIDDLQRLRRLRPAMDPDLPEQTLDGFRLRHWRKGGALVSPAVQAADLVVAAFGCRLPEDYLSAMAARAESPAWLNLEYLSAEDWVAGSHGLPSPHPRLKLTEHFYFPGFRAGTGGLLKEAGYDARRRAFDGGHRQAFLRHLDVHVPEGAPLVSLFCYPGADVEGLFAAMASGPTVHCVIPEGVTPLAPPVGKSRTTGSLTLHGMPFVEPDDYDQLLWSCDLNFVRGEDSAVRAQWAECPLLWQFYPQDDDAHRVKLDAFLALYTSGMAPELAGLVTGAMRRWNGAPEDGSDLRAGAGSHAPGWPALLAALPAWRLHAGHWAARLGAQTELAAGLIEFAGKIG
ncbi:MAG: hypothetical protein RL404_1108 [Pseudomonadota bacterium]|jgi:uncharacterized repeat protein (TIGR03837 family)